MFPVIGELVSDRYRVDQHLGEGGFSAVYAATDVAVHRPVALKCFKPDGPDGYDPRVRARFRREVEMVARLRSPHTVRLYDHGESAAGVLYLVFEYIEGEDLDERLRRRGPLDVSSALHVLDQLLEALAEAHAMGLLHRDIKSSNARVFEYMGDPLTVKLLDFGLARGTDGGHPGVTATGEFVGTPRYMAPEQLLDEELTPATDIYCLGLVAYEMIFGLDILRANSVHHQIERLREGHLIAPRAREGLPDHLVRVLEKMTAREPADRYPQVASVQHALANPAEPPTTPLIRTIPSEEPRPAPHRRWWIAGAVVAVVAAGALFLLAPASEEPVAPVALKRTTPTIVAQPTSSDMHAADAVDASRHDTACRRSVGHSVIRDVPLIGERWLMYAPPGLDPDVEAPLVILLHQHGHSAETFLTTSGFVAQANEHHFVLMAPNDGGDDPWEPSETHVAQVLSLRDFAIEDFCIDPRRVFVVGHGSGGALADTIMCEGWVRGFATHALARRRDEVFCEPVRPMPFAQFYPKKSKYEPFEGGVSPTWIDRQSVHEIEARWFGRNGCDGVPVGKTSYDDSECFAYDCETPFMSCHVDGGHGWPGTPRRSREFAFWDGDGPEPDENFPMAELIWRFFAALEPLDPVEPP